MTLYKPQYQFPTPAGFRDMDFDHYYDSQVLPQLVRIPGDQNPTLNIPFKLDPDAPFLWRGFKFFSFEPELVSADNWPNYGVRFKDPYGNPLCPPDQFVPVWLFGMPPQDYPIEGSGPPCLLPGGEEIYCPASGVIYMDIFSYDTTPWTRGGPNMVQLAGVKRYPEAKPNGSQ